MKPSRTKDELQSQKERAMISELAKKRREKTAKRYSNKYGVDSVPAKQMAGEYQHCVGQFTQELLKEVPKEGNFQTTTIVGYRK